MRLRTFETFFESKFGTDKHNMSECMCPSLISFFLSSSSSFLLLLFLHHNKQGNRNRCGTKPISCTYIYVDMDEMKHGKKLKRWNRTKDSTIGWKNEARKFSLVHVIQLCVNVCNSMRIHLVHIPRASHTWRRYKNRSSQYAEREITRDSSPINWTCLHCFGSRAVHSSWLCVYVSVCIRTYFWG